MKKLETIYYRNGEENEEYWNLLEDLKKNGKAIKSEWAGAYLDSTYEKDGFIYVVSVDMDYGIQYSIEKYTKEGK